MKRQNVRLATVNNSIQPLADLTKQHINGGAAIIRQTMTPSNIIKPLNQKVINPIGASFNRTRRIAMKRFNFV